MGDAIVTAVAPCWPAFQLRVTVR